jgi:hypothetical protein
MTNDFGWVENPYLSAEKMLPLAQRIEKERPQLKAGLEKLRELLGEERFEKNISSLVNLTKNNNTLLVVAKNMLQRSAIERECIKELKEAFSVQFVKVVG